MSWDFPCEVITWYFLPTVRKELTKYLVNEKKISRKETAALLSLTPAAVSQYLNNKRGNELVFSKTDLKKIKSLGDTLLETKDRKELISNTCKFCKEIRSRLIMCALHKKQNPKLVEGCDICLGNI